MSKRHLLLTTAAAAALVGAMTTSSMAFDIVDWNWQSSVASSVNVSLIDPELAGVTQIEKLQVHLGNLTSHPSLSTIDGTSEHIGNSATSVSNNQSITTDTPLLLHDAQIGVGAIVPTLGEDDSPNWEGFQDGLLALAAAYAGPNPQTGLNEDTLLAFGTLLAAGNGYITPAAINATANVNTATVDTNLDNNATAVTNNASWKVDTFAQTSPGTGILVADLTQVGIANVAASAGVTGITLDGAANLNNNATAVGNNVNVNVGPLNAFASP
jgi:hypothetical protein